MTTSTRSTSQAADAPPRIERDEPTQRRWVPGVLTVAAIGGAGFVLAECRTGPGRLRNPTPTVTHMVGGVPRAEKAFLGLSNAPMDITYFSVVATVIALAVVIRRAYREGRWGPTLTLIVATTALTIVDPFMNWAPYVVYNPHQLHLSQTWAWASLSPSIEPVAVFVVYWWFFLAPAWIALALYRRLARRSPESSWVNRRPHLALLAVGYAVCVIFDAVVEILVIRLGNYTYNQVIGGLSFRAGTPWQFPWYECILFGAVMAPTGALMWRDDSGQSWCDRVVRVRRWMLSRPNLAPAIAAFAVLMPLYLGYGAIMTGIRVTHSATTLAKPYNYEDMKVYDPQGDWQRSGYRGPFYRGTLSAYEADQAHTR